MSDDSGSWTFEYNADGLRVYRSNGTNEYKYYYNGDKLTRMVVNGENITFGYDANGTPQYVLYGDHRYFYLTNLQGDVVAIVNTSGETVVEYSYDAWGNVLPTTGTMAGTLGKDNPLRYRGYVYDEETGLYYLQSRYYDPVLGRFINADGYTSTGQGFVGNNMFAYCNNSPVSHSDHSGKRMVCVGADLSGGTSSNLVDSICKTISNTAISVAKNINISGGVGLGLYAEGEVSGMEVGLGTYYDFVAFEWQDGELAKYEYGYAGITSTVLVYDVGAEVSVIVDGVNTPIVDKWLLINKQQNSIGIFGAALYPPLFGGRFEVNLDWVGLYQDLGWMQ